MSVLYNVLLMALQILTFQTMNKKSIVLFVAIAAVRNNPLTMTLLGEIKYQPFSPPPALFKASFAFIVPFGFYNLAHVMIKNFWNEYGSHWHKLNIKMHLPGWNVAIVVCRFLWFGRDVLMSHQRNIDKHRICNLMSDKVKQMLLKLKCKMHDIARLSAVCYELSSQNRINFRYQYMEILSNSKKQMRFKHVLIKIAKLVAIALHCFEMRPYQ